VLVKIYWICDRKVSDLLLLLSVGLLVANAPDVHAAMWLIVLPLDVPTLTTSRLPKRS
jgi:hypothetical protein